MFSMTGLGKSPLGPVYKAFNRTLKTSVGRHERRSKPVGPVLPWVNLLQVCANRLESLLSYIVQTSNKSSNELQTLIVGNSGKAVFEEVASLCQR